MKHLVHWDDVEPKRRAFGHLASTMTDLGSPAGTIGVGVTRFQVDPGKWSTPAHIELIEEEIFYVLGGSGFAWMDGETRQLSFTLVIGADRAITRHLAFPPRHLHTPAQQQFKKIATAKMPKRGEGLGIENGEFVELTRMERGKGELRGRRRECADTSAQPSKATACFTTREPASSAM